MTTTRTHNLTTADIDAGLTDERWLGWGYLGERSRSEQNATEADAVVLRFARVLGWDREDLFHWMNSKDGRWFGDWAFGCDGPEPAWMPSIFPKRPAR